MCHQEVGKILSKVDARNNMVISEDEINNRIAELADEIDTKYNEIDLVVILRGGVPFASDLAKQIKTCGVRMHYMIASSYENKKQSSGFVELNYGTLRGSSYFDRCLKDKNVIIVDDIFDSGRTLNKVKTVITEMNPKSVEICVLIKKKKTKEYNLDIDYYGFEISDYFVAGYGLDDQGLNRNLPFIYRVD